MSNRYSGQSARQRWRPLSSFMWLSIPVGLAVFTAVNMVQITASWHDYRHGWVAAVLLTGLVGVFLLIWFRSRDGIGPALSALALITGPAACLIIATQLNQTTLTSPANWVSGFCVVPIILLPFSRPPEEMALGIAALIAVQAAVMVNAGRSLRDLHTIVMSGGAGAVIGVGIIFLVVVIRRMDAIRRRQARGALAAIWSRIYYQDTTVSLQHRVTATQLAAAEMLDALAAGIADITDPEVQRECDRLRAALRRELQDLGQRSLLLTELMPKDGGFGWDIDDAYNASQHFKSEDRLAIVGALSEIRALKPDGITVKVLPLRASSQAKVVIISGSEALPDTPEWRAVRDQFSVHVPAAGRPGERQIYWWNMQVMPFFWRSNDQDSDRR
jgi:hypothetical protein